MANWKRTLHIKHLLSEQTDSATIIAAATKIAEKAKPIGAPTAKFDKAITFAATDEDIALLVFDDAMNDLYDWADDNLVWVA